MRVTLDVDALSPEPSGIGRYTWELCKGLAQSARIDELRYFARGRLVADPKVLLTNAKLPRRRRLQRLIERCDIKRTLRSTLVHGPNYFLPETAERGLITVHDLSVFRFPETHPAARVHLFEDRFQRSLERAAHVITDTETIRRELIQMFSVHPDCVTAVPLGVSTRYRSFEGNSVSEETLGRWSLQAGRYGLCVSTLEPRKRISELILAWGKLPERVRKRIPLVLAGGEGWRNEQLRGQIENAKSEGWLRHLGFVDEGKLPALYSGARLFIYPSIYEGFGLPPVEAMASGVPVLVSNRSCLPEVCGEAARYVDPDDVEAFSRAIEESLADEQWRTQAVARGLARAAQFTWARCIDDTVAVYQRVRGTVVGQAGHFGPACA